MCEPAAWNLKSGGASSSSIKPSGAGSKSGSVDKRVEVEDKDHWRSLS